MNKLLMGLLILTAGPAFGSSESKKLKKFSAEANWKCVASDQTKNADINDLLIYDTQGASYTDLKKVLVSGGKHLVQGNVIRIHQKMNDWVYSLLYVTWEDKFGDNPMGLYINLDDHDSSQLRSRTHPGYVEPSGLDIRRVKMDCASL